MLITFYSIDTGRQYPVKIAPVVGELIEAGHISESGFLALQSMSKISIN